jgi:DNA-directed RNA polymerase specialized sigma24 family protein
LSGSNRRAADEEDVVLSAFDTFYRNAAAGRFPDLNDRDGLWKLLFAIVDRKSLDHVKSETRQKRGGGKVRGDSVFLRGDDTTLDPVGVMSREPTPEFAAEVADQNEQLLGDLQNESLSEVALMTDRTSR